MSRPTIVLSMIVKNEEKVIERCLFSCLKLIDYFVICDTGSTDKTIEVINNFSKKYNLKGEVHQHEWVNFAHNRNLSLEIAKKKGTYVYWMDADDILEYKPNFVKPKYTSEAYVMDIYYDPVQYKRVHLVRSDIESKWTGVLHECLEVPPETKIEFLPDVKMVIVGGGGGRNTDPQKHQKDAVILEKALQDDPENTRYMFYLAQSYRNYGAKEKAIEWYEKRSKYNQHPEEQCYAKYQVGFLKVSCEGKYRDSECLYDFLQAHQFFPYRVEPLFYAVVLLNKEKMFESAYSLGLRFVHMKEPDPMCMLFTELETYRFRLPFEVAFAAFNCGKYVEAMLIYLHLYFHLTLNAEQKKQVENNISACCNKLDLKQNVITKKNISAFLDQTNENSIRQLFYM